MKKSNYFIGGMLLLVFASCSGSMSADEIRIEKAKQQELFDKQWEPKLHLLQKKAENLNLKMNKYPSENPNDYKALEKAQDEYRNYFDKMADAQAKMLRDSKY